MTPQTQASKSPEILAPVGNRDMALAAIHNGAHALYVGMPGFNARARTYDFDYDELADLIELSHHHDVKVYIALNILIFQNEWPPLLEGLQTVMVLNPDAFIIQDIGLLRIIKTLNPKQQVHASTQMSVSGPEGMEYLSDLDISRFILAREMSLEEIATTTKTRPEEVEVFVHGALCVAYSGQCLTSERMGGRSANRGQCAQSCRMPYEVMVDGKVTPNQNAPFPLSPLDLCILPKIAELINTGVHSLKIEGRYKEPEYVASTVKAYSQAIQQALEGKKVQPNTQDLEVSFSRGLHTGWLEGTNHQTLVQGQTSNHKGLLIGRIIQVLGKRKFPTLLIESNYPLSTGDSLYICSQEGRFINGGKVYQLKHCKQNYEIEFAKDFSLKGLRKGSVVYLNRSPALDKTLQRSWKDKNEHKKTPIFMSVKAHKNETLQIKLSDAWGNEVFAESMEKLDQAMKAPISTHKLQNELSALGGSPYSLAECQIDLQDNLYIHHKVIRELRRSLVDKLTRLRTHKAQPILFSEQAQKLIESTLQKAGPDDEKSSLPLKQCPSLTLLLRDPEQIDALAGLNNISCVYLDFPHGVPYGPSLEKLKQLGLATGICTLRMMKPEQHRFLKDIIKHKPDCILIRNLGALQVLQSSTIAHECQLIGDFSLNISNALSGDYFLTKGIDRLCPSYDLNKVQLFSLLSASQAQRYEITIHQYMPSFHMEYCVYARFLSDGSDISNCGIPCRQKKIELRDEKGIDHPVFPDKECRNTMYNGTPQSAALYLPEFIEAGVKYFRIEALNEKSDELKRKILIYQDILNSPHQAETKLSQLGVEEKFGISEGQMSFSDNYQSRKKE
ncbi:MAG: U32 family peptidase [Planctomycetes bacterium]|nr:U32 family peptidase [Planctomycetota bacterium]